MMNIFVKLLLVLNYSSSRPSKRAIEDYAMEYDEYKMDLKQNLLQLKERKQWVLNLEQRIEDNRKRIPIIIEPFLMGESYAQNRGYVFQVEFNSGTVEVVLSKSRETDEGYLRITGPDGFKFGYKWSSTKVFDEWAPIDNHVEVCTKQSRLELAEILELIDGVEIKTPFRNGPTKDQWIDGVNRYGEDNCLPDLNYRLATDEKFDPKIFRGLGIKLTKGEMEKIENAKNVFLSNCKGRHC